MKTKRSWLLALVIFCVAQNPLWVSAAMRYGILDYNKSTCTTPTIMSWLTSRFELKVNGCNPNKSNVAWPMYFDGYGASTVTAMNRMKDWAVTNNVNYEEMLLHAKVDYTATPETGEPSWSQMDKFDNFEGAKGVMRTLDNIVFTDLTSSAYASNVTWQNNMYIGYEEAFAEINLVFSTAGSGITRVWEYWNGSSWATLTVTDGTNSFKSSGQISFTPPSDWSRTIINSSRNKYFVRCRITAATVNPITSSVKGDNWLRGGTHLCRGWDASNSGIINSGELAYNPTPPAGSSAKFRYQSRISYWGSNHFAAHPADFQTVDGVSTRTWAAYAASEVVRLTDLGGYTYTMQDMEGYNISGQISAYTPSMIDLNDKTANTWMTEVFAKYSDMVTRIHAVRPNLKVGINSPLRNTYAGASDWNLAEYHTFNYKTGNPRGIAVSDSSQDMAYDDYLPANNPFGKIGLLIYSDTTYPEGVVPYKTALWDRSNRGPIVALSKHLIAANNNTIFAYYTQGGYVYSNTDEVFLIDNSVWHQATQGTPPLSSVKRWGTWFPAMGVDFGVPDINGWNGGVRSFAWKSHTEIGGVQDVWRRDYTNAIILHRPATYSTTDAEYNTPSSVINLGGTYYPLMADGTTLTGVTSLSLRAGEGSILMKAPNSITLPIPMPPPPSTQPFAPTNLMIIK